MTEYRFDPFEPNETQRGEEENSSYRDPSGNGDAPFVMPQMPLDPIGKSSQNYGLIGLILTLTCCSVVGLILGIMALTRASASRRLLGYESAQAAVGKVLGILSIVFSAIRIISTIAWVALFTVGVLSGLAELNAAGGTVI